MKTKRHLIAAALVAVVAAASFYAWANLNQAPNIGTAISTNRYVLFGGNYSIDGDKQIKENEASVFKLDTYSGRVWRLKVSIVDGKRIEVWSPVEEPSQPPPQQSVAPVIP